MQDTGPEQQGNSEDLLNELAERLQTAGPGLQLQGAERQELEKLLLACLTGTDRLKTYMRALQNVVGGGQADWEILEETQHQSALQDGLPVFSDKDLVELALNPIALWDLHDAIGDDQTGVWREPLAAPATQPEKEDPVALGRRSILKGAVAAFTGRAGLAASVAVAAGTASAWAGFAKGEESGFAKGRELGHREVLQEAERGKRLLEEFWHPFGAEAQGVAVALGNVTFKDPETGETIAEGYVGRGDVLALSFLETTLMDLGTPRKRIHLLSGKRVNEPNIDLGKPLVVLGGPRASLVSFKTLAKVYDVPHPERPGALRELGRGFTFRVNIANGNAFCEAIGAQPGGQNGEPGIYDVAAGKTCTVDLEKSDAVLIIRADLPCPSGQRYPCVLVCGYEEYGTGMGMRALTTPGSKVLSELNRNYEKNRFAELLLSVDKQTGGSEIFSSR